MTERRDSLSTGEIAERRMWKGARDKLGRVCGVRYTVKEGDGGEGILIFQPTRDWRDYQNSNWSKHASVGAAVLRAREMAQAYRKRCEKQFATKPA